MANTVVVHHNGKDDLRHSKNHQSENKNTKTHARPVNTTSNDRKVTVDSSKIIKQSFESRGFSKEVSQVMLAARKPATREQYGVYIKAWYAYCSQKRVSKTRASVSQGLNFMEETRQLRSLSYSSVNVMRSALSSVIAPFKGTTFGDHADTVTYMKGVFNESPKVPKYQEIWDLNVVLDYLKKVGPAHKLPLKSLTLKTVTLLMIVTGQRAQTLSLLDLQNCQVSQNQILFVITENVKTSKPGTGAVQLKLQKYVPDQRLCVVRYVKEYIKRTKAVRTSSQLFISYQKPHQAVLKGTIAHWIKLVLKLSGINTEIFQGHSVRSASCSKASRQGVQLNVILKQGGWRSASTFQKYYNKPLSQAENVFAKSVLS